MATATKSTAKSFALSKKVMSSYIREIQLVQGNWQYRAREDQTILKPNILVQGSQNVLTNVSGRIGNRKGYTLDGQADSTDPSLQQPILSSFDWNTHIAAERHLRAGFNSNGSNGKLQYRYVASAGDKWNGNTFTANQVYWIDLATSLTSVNFNFAEFWDTIELKAFLKYVDGSSNIYEWTGGITTLASATADTITKNGTTTWAEENFYNVIKTKTATTIAFVDSNPDTITDSGSGFVTAGFRNGMKIKVSGATNVGNNSTFTIATVTAGVITLVPTDTLTAEAAGNSITITQVTQVTINNTVYTYTGGGATTTLTGVTPNPSAEPVNSVVHQTPIITPSTAILSLPALNYSLIANFKQYLILGDLANQSIYGSVENNAYSFAFSSPTRLVGQGFFFTLDSFPIALKASDADFYVSGGISDWYISKFTLSADLSSETIEFVKLKTTALQAAQSQAFVTEIKNNIAFLSNEPIVNSLGSVTNIYQTPQISNLSYPIVNDIDAYDATDGAVIFHRMYLYVSFPRSGVIRIYNMTNQEVDKNGNAITFWEAPQTIPVARFSIINGELYGHSYFAGETYKLFDGYNDNGQPIPAIAVFAYNNYGSRTVKKMFNMFMVEGYINQATTLTLGIRKELDGCATDITKTIFGTNTNYVCVGGTSSPLGKEAIGVNPFGGDVITASTLPPKFRTFQTFNPIPSFFESQISFYSVGIDQQWEIISFGAAIKMPNDLATNLTV